MARLSVSRLIRHGAEGTALFTSDGNSRTADFVRAARQRVPRGTYRVTYRLDPRGALLASYEYISNPAVGRGFVVCFLPLKWAGQRVTRTVTPLPGRR